MDVLVNCTEIWQGETDERKPITTAELTPALKMKDRREVKILYVDITQNQKSILTMAHYDLLYSDTTNLTVNLTSRTRQFPTTPITISSPSTATSSHFSASGHRRSMNTVLLNPSLTGRQDDTAQLLMKLAHSRVGETCVLQTRAAITDRFTVFYHC